MGAKEKQRGRAEGRQEGGWRAGGEGLEGRQAQRPKLNQGYQGLGVGTVMENMTLV